MTWRVERDISGYPVRRSNEADRRYRAAGYWTDETLVDHVRARLREDPHRTLVIEGERHLTRAEAWDQALRLSRYFMDRGLKPGDTVSFQLPNWSEAVALVLAVRMCGLVINPIQPIYREAEVAYILADCRSKMLFAPQSFRGFDHAGLIARLRPRLPDLKDVVILRGEPGPGATAWDDAVGRPPIAEADLPRLDASAVMMAMHTSGTTSRAKGVLHSHQTYGFKPEHMRGVWELSADDVVFMPSPISHINGILWGIDIPWRFGLTSVLMDAWSPEEGLQLIKQHGCTVIGGATPFLQQIIEAADTRPEMIASLRLFFCGGASVPADLIRKAAAVHPAGLFVRAYGCTESPTSSMGARGASPDLRAETDGEVFAPTDMRIVASDGEEVADGEEGEILVRGPEQFLGYLREEDNVEAFDDDGFFRTGDLGRRLGGRHLLITGRKKDIIIRSGENISPKEVEDILLRHPDIADIAIVAMPSPKTGEMGCAFVVVREGAVVDLPSIRRFLETAGIARQKFPEHVEIVADLPRTPTGKVRKDVLRDEARAIANGAAA